MRRVRRTPWGTICSLVWHGPAHVKAISSYVVGALVVWTLTLTASQARPWGDEGHQIVALIAQPFLTPAAAQQVRSLLANDPDVTLPEAATWADRIKLRRPEPRPWHFIDIPLQA